MPSTKYCRLPILRHNPEAMAEYWGGETQFQNSRYGTTYKHPYRSNVKRVVPRSREVVSPFGSAQ